MRQILNDTQRPRAVRVFRIAIGLLIGYVFIRASVPKIQQPYLFLSTVYGYELVGAQVGALVAMIVPWLELFVGICLLGGVVRYGSSVVSIVLLGMFMYAQISAMYRGLKIGCGCFGGGFLAGEEVSYATISFTTVLLGLAIVGLPYWRTARSAK